VRTGSIVTILALGCGIVTGGPLASRGPRSAFRQQVRLVEVPIVVTDERDRPLQELRKEDFRLFEDGIEQSIRYFSGEDGPVSVGIVFDASSSMETKMRHARAALAQFLKTTTGQDEFLLVRFSTEPAVACGFTSNAEEIEGTLASTFADGATALWDAIYLSIDQMKHAGHQRRALVVLSDGGDNNSRYTLREIRSLARESDVRVFSICVLDKSRALAAIAEESGGRYYRVRHLAELPDVAQKISADLHSQYVLGYSPANSRNDGRYRKIQVKLAHPPRARWLRASWRHGYYAPGL
jgi:Ca-activated chloride channel family protein